MAPGDEEEDYGGDVAASQMLAPRAQDTDATEILNALLREYDKKLRPDIGGKVPPPPGPRRSPDGGTNEQVCRVPRDAGVVV